ncbi:hypothetical protein Ae168Ps1_5393c [Pseudonocardia sp. Ae168_Ps1]|nr:hypothetical protein Ae168Ps1_5393c [Pseudonocardia sp. Ae168_Ps1]OLL77555.1 hypothetical protein Ae150APs1_5933 [Pseudonocardia sp. Ae150A_Ps1]OLL88331.1 hypothetical protein Ae263Ps1_5386c [Pseudonocardia sp. Ae263_Ps1]OLL91645.1 hypothetical protein Ae356Ps1_1542 [Pseudonocardia sp. Ae356_Ps1]
MRCPASHVATGRGGTLPASGIGPGKKDGRGPRPGGTGCCRSPRLATQRF